jgi:hypothetical protein
MEQSTDSILNALVNKAQELERRVKSLQDLQNELARVRSAIAALTSSAPEQLKIYEPRASYFEKIRYILSHSPGIAAIDIINYIYNREPERGRNSIYNAVAVTISRMKADDQVRASKNNGKAIYYLKEQVEKGEEDILSSSSHSGAGRQG